MSMERFYCTPCGDVGVWVDEDHCCKTCGTDCVVVNVLPRAQPTEAPAEPKKFCKFGMCGGKADHDGYCQGHRRVVSDDFLTNAPPPVAPAESVEECRHGCKAGGPIPLCRYCDAGLSYPSTALTQTPTEEPKP